MNRSGGKFANRVTSVVKCSCNSPKITFFESLPLPITAGTFLRLCGFIYGGRYAGTRGDRGAGDVAPSAVLDNVQFAVPDVLPSF